MLNYPPSVDALVDTLFDEDDGKTESDHSRVFNIRVIKYLEDKSSLNWIVKRTSEEFIENHQFLVKKLGLLKKFSFSSSKSSSVFNFHSDTKHLDVSSVNEYLKELSVLNPIPMAVVTFLALENANRAEKLSSKAKVRLSLADSFSRLSSNNLQHMNSDNNISSEDSPLPRTSTYIESSDFVPHSLDHGPKKHRASWKGKIGGTSDIRHHSLHDFVHCADQELILKCFFIAYVAGFLHAILTGCRRLLYHLLYLKHNRWGTIKSATSQYIKETMLRGRYSLEGVVLALIAMMFIDKVFGFLAGMYFRQKLKTRIDGRYNVHFESICFRFGVGKNQVIFSGFEWRNPPLFDQTPYFIHIEEIAFTFDMMSLYDAFFRYKSIKVPEICISNCNVYIEKIQVGNTVSGIENVSGSSKKHLSFPHNGSETHSKEDLAANGDKTAEVRVNMWAAVGKKDYSEMKASSSSSKSKAVSVVNSTVTVTTGGAASGTGMRRSSSRNALFDNRSSSTGTTLKGANVDSSGRSISVDNHFGASDAAVRLREEMLANTLSNSGKGEGVSGIKKSTSLLKLSSLNHSGSSNTASKGVRRHSSHGLGSLFHHHHHKTATSATNGSGASLMEFKKHSHHNREDNDDEDGGGLKRLDSFYSINSADSFSDLVSESQKTGYSSQPTDDADDYSHFDLLDEDTPSGSVQPSNEIYHRHGKQADRSKVVSVDNVDEPELMLTENERAYLKNKRLFGFPYRLDISLLVFKNLQMHIQDLLNASHTDHANQSTLKLAVFTMTHEELTKSAAHGHHRKGVYMDEVMWRTVNAAMNELLKTNKVTLLSIFASAAANQTAAAVRNLTRRLFKSGKE